MASFNVLTESWIPVVSLKGEKKLLGIVEVLENAHHLLEISDASPMVEYGLYRFFSCFLMDALRPKDLTELEDILWAGRFDPLTIQTYIQACRADGTSFDLFDQERPFLQSAYQPAWDPKEPKPIQTLDYTVPSGNNHTHFDHRKAEDLSLSYPEAARLLCAQYLFCTPIGAKEYPSGVNGAPPYFALVRGKNLFETFCRNLIPINWVKGSFDQPPVFWRMEEDVCPKEKVNETSWLLGLVFPTRRITLLPDEETLRVHKLYLSQGRNYVNKEGWTDPAVAYQYTESGRIPLRPSLDRAVWRNLNDLLDISGQHAPMVLKACQELCEEDLVEVDLYGVETNNANYLQIMRHTLRFSMGLAENESCISFIRNMLFTAEKMAAGLRKSFEKGDKKKSVLLPKQLVSEAVQQFYERCEPVFWHICNTKLVDKGLGNAEYDAALYKEWVDQLTGIALDCHGSLIRRLHLKAHALAMLAGREKELWNAVKGVKEERE